jgi:hypothetical protein
VLNLPSEIFQQIFRLLDKHLIGVVVLKKFNLRLKFLDELKVGFKLGVPCEVRSITSAQRAIET